jgi:transglutaminase-like putative cysteine protease
MLGSVEERATVHRRPPALLPPSIARLGGFAALALLGALQWQRMVEGLSSGRALLWVLVAVAAAVAVLWADTQPASPAGTGGLRRVRRAATLAVVPLALLAAYASSGIALVLLKPRRIDELGAGLSHGAEALASVQMPYAGADPWPSDTLQLLGAVLCVAAALLAFWPRTQRTPSGGSGGRTQRTSSAGTGGYPFLSLALLLILVAAPVVSLGGTEPVALGVVLTALTVCFLWLERLPLRPGLGIAAMLALALAGALPLASAADGDDPWFDYKSFAEGFGPDEPLAFDWGHSYGRLDWPREGTEVLRVAATRPSYWKVRKLDDFDGVRWLDAGIRLGGSDPELDLPPEWRVQAGWRETVRVTLRRLQTTDVLGPGTILGVEDTARIVVPAGEPGVWSAQTEFRGGDSYTVRSYVPRPSPEQLAGSGAGADSRRASDLNVTVPVAGDASGVPGAPAVPVQIRFPPFQPHGRGLIPHAVYPTLVRSHDGDRALRRSAYARTWRLAKRLRRDAETPYEYVLAVNRYLQDGFTYDEDPAASEPGRATLDAFLFDTRSGYCQHFSGAMALLLRMGGIPTRVVTGFSPGGYSKSKRAWIVRDTDAHSWVEAWFDEWGWVTVDPTPAETPARSQIAALERPPESGTDRGDAASGDAGSAPRTGGVRPDLLGTQSGPGGARGGAADGGTSWWWCAPAAPLLLALAAWVVLRRRRRSLSPAAALDRAVAELEAALRRAGRPATAGTTLRQLEQRLGRTPEAAAYLRALRAGRYAAVAPPPTAGGRRALRRELAAGGGPGGRLRALWALPPWRG